MKKVTLQDIADALGVSRISVWKVFSGREGVSDELRRKIIAKASELNYNFPKDIEIPDEYRNAERPLNISVTVSRPETSLFWMTIIHEIAKELSKYNVNLIYTYLPCQIPMDYCLPSQLLNGTIDGIIILNVYNERLIRMLSKLHIPKVFFDTINSIDFEELSGDLVLTTGKSCVYKITEHMISQGRTNIGFIGDINYARTNYERYEGFSNAMAKHKLNPKQEYCFTGPIGIDSYEEEIHSFLNNLKDLPEAFVCASDCLACILWEKIKAMNYQIPKDIFISGFNNIQECSHVKNLTTVQVYTQALGLRLATQVLCKIKNPTMRHELIYISSEVIFRASTNSSIEEIAID